MPCSAALFPTWYHCAGVKIKYGYLALRFISFFTEEFAADIAVEGINVLRIPAGEDKVSSFECFSLIGRKYFNKDIPFESCELQIKYGNLSFRKIEGENFGDWPSIRQCFLLPTFSAVWYFSQK